MGARTWLWTATLPMLLLAAGCEHSRWFGKKDPLPEKNLPYTPMANPNQPQPIPAGHSPLADPNTKLFRPGDPLPQGVNPTLDPRANTKPQVNSPAISPGIEIPKTPVRVPASNMTDSRSNVIKPADKPAPDADQLSPLVKPLPPIKPRNPLGPPDETIPLIVAPDAPNVPTAPVEKRVVVPPPSMDIVPPPPGGGAYSGPPPEPN